MKAADMTILPEPDRWPSDFRKTIFLARAVDQLARAMYSDWKGAKDQLNRTRDSEMERASARMVGAKRAARLSAERPAVRSVRR
jgi:hypothetical protein